MGRYADDHRRSLEDPAGFWGEQAQAVDWFARPQQVLDDSRAPIYRWFTGGVLNTCFNALDRHVIRGRGDEPALIFHSAITGDRRTYTYAELLERVAQLGGALRELGVNAGDRVVLYLPMVPEAAIAMLACARIGAVHSVVFGGFAATELAARIDDARPKVVISASCGLEADKVVAYKPLLDAALAKSTHQPDYCVIYQRPQLRAEMVPGRDIDFGLLMKPGSFPPAVCAEVAATDPLYILYTSGTTGRPKGIVRDHGGHAVALTYSMGAVYGLGPG
ncbi:MAG: propionyl-CoA synthetase, partial [Friedmanniella sp.]|nr:propionyl-CoA synthetase [Friedmanniella sp.]